MAEETKKKFNFKYWRFFLYLYLGIILFFLLLNLGVFGSVPSINELKDPKNVEASVVISSDSVDLGKIFTHNRVPVYYDQIPDQVVNALIATEDSRFYIHNGIDPVAIIGVMRGMIGGGNRGGGSTITQQLAKNLFPRGSMNKIQLVVRKFKEWIIAVKLERNLTKHEIIAAYLNTVEFSDNAFGINAASRTYFNKDVDQLSVDEGAILIGMLKAPYRYNPRIHPENSIERRNVVLSKMREFNFLSEEEYQMYKNKPIKLDFKKNQNFYKAAPYFVRYVEKYLRNYFKKHPKPDGTSYDIYSDGLKIYTTIDMTMQKYAEEAAREHLEYYQKLLNNHWRGYTPWYSHPKFFMRHVKKSERYKDLKAKGLSEEDIIKELKKPVKMKIFTYEEDDKEVDMSPWDSIKYYNMILQTGFMSVDPRTGHIKTWVGGADFNHFKYDHVNINTKRQVGSVFKPFLYTVAIDQKGYSPCFQVPNQRIVFRPGNPKWKLAAAWSPSNSGGGYGGSPTLRVALSKSLNTVSARLMYEVGPIAVIALCRNLGIDSNTTLQPYPSICLGTPEISVFEMVGAYSAYANQGLYTKPTFITKVEDRYGNVIFENYPDYKESFSPEVAFVMQDLMKSVVDIGTAKRLKGRYGLKGEICGKTGTTQSNADGWFIGFTPELVAGVWVGCDDRLVRFRSTGLGQGAAMALPIWGKFFQKLSKDPKYKYVLESKFETIDPSKRTIITDCSKYRGWGLSEKKATQLIINNEMDGEAKYGDEDEEMYDEDGFSDDESSGGSYDSDEDGAKESKPTKSSKSSSKDNTKPTPEKEVKKEAVEPKKKKFRLFGGKKNKD